MSVCAIAVGICGKAMVGRGSAEVIRARLEGQCSKYVRGTLWYRIPGL